MSLAGESAAELRRKANSTLGYYNVQLGPTAWKFGASLGVTATDNANLQSNSQGQDDVILQPQVNGQMWWPITERNTLNLNVGVGYSEYIRHPGLNRMYLGPGTELSFDVFISDFAVNIHNRVSITQDSYQDPTVAGSGNYSQLQNDAGVAVLWDLNKIIVRVGYDHVDYIDLTSGTYFQPRDGSSELFYANAGYALQPEMTAGVEFGAGLINYSGGFGNGYTNLVNNAVQWNWGGFYTWRLSDNMDLKLNSGYTVFSPQTSTATPVGDTGAVYFQMALRHRVNRQISYALSAGRTVNLAFFGGSVDMYYVSLQPNWSFFRYLVISTPITYQTGSELDYYAHYNFDWLSAGINLARPITQKLSANLGYLHILRTANLAGANYDINNVTVSLSYAF